VSTATVAVLDYGMGNLHSVSRALAKVGAEAVVTSDANETARADALLIPGVGHFGACVRALRSAGLEDVARGAAIGDRPVFGVCVGMQILFEASDEDPDPGLGVLPGRVRRLPDSVKVPHMGWNTVAWTGRAHPYTAGLPDGVYYYFVHSFAPDVSTETVGATDHGRTFAAVVARDNVFATQFHPEKSGEVGLALYEAFVREVRAA
jgi:glutamine amidotransferase